MARRYFGVWRLIPQACKYDVGQPPLKATYSFTPTSDQPQKIDVRIFWTDVQNNDLSIHYQINLDGNRHIQNLNGVKLLLLHELAQNGILKSITFNQSGENILMQSWRQLKQADSILQVVIETSKESGVNRIFQRYESMIRYFYFLNYG